MQLVKFFKTKFIIQEKELPEPFLPKKKKIKPFFRDFVLKLFESFNRKIYPVTSFHISYIFSISYSRANTFLTISKSNGSLCLSYNCGDLGFAGKQKKITNSTVFKLLRLFINKHRRKYAPHPIELHLLNTAKFRHSVVRYLKKFFFIKSVKGFSTTPYNGVRGKKPRRKKYITKLPLR